MDREHEEQMINNFRSEMEEKIKEKEREQQEEKQERERKEEAVEEEAEVATKVMEMVTEEVASEVESQEGQTEPALPKDESIKVTKKKNPEKKLIFKNRLRFTPQLSTMSSLSRRWLRGRLTRSPTARRSVFIFFSKKIKNKTCGQFQCFGNLSFLRENCFRQIYLGLSASIDRKYVFEILI